MTSGNQIIGCKYGLPHHAVKMQCESNLQCIIIYENKGMLPAHIIHFIGWTDSSENQTWCNTLYSTARLFTYSYICLHLLQAFFINNFHSRI